MLKLIRRVVIVLLIPYLALFGLTKAIRYPEPIAAIKLGLAPASKTPDLMPFHIIEAKVGESTPWLIGAPEEINEVTWGGVKISFEEFLANTQTNVFLVIRGGKITYEKYLNGKTESTVLPSYSVAKTMTSLVIGQLIDEGKIKESDTFVEILPDFKADSSFDQVRIKDLLDMNSGVGVSDNYPTGPSGWGVAIAQMYATTDMNFFMRNNRKMSEKPGTYPEYRSVDTQMLGLIIQKVTGNRLADEFSDRIWKKVGAEYDATWNVDKVDGHEKAFCCFNAAARDFARVGLALMSGSPKIASTSWKARLSNPVVNLDYGWGYAAQIWHPYPGINLMMGLHGQYIYQDALHDTVIVKLSDMPTSADGTSDKIAAVLREISEKKG
ncbi:MAG: class C beta-lactamase-related serine hydrolase [Candidatus Planktophila sp.]|nr:class C beta-lactamase-related serine hydrolase [Candidatus Planktophila sp.]